MHNETVKEADMTRTLSYYVMLTFHFNIYELFVFITFSCNFGTCGYLLEATIYL
jgi:hypothetical protein